MVYGAISRVLFPVCLVGMVGVGVWGYQEHNEKNSILIKAENQYQRAFHDLNFHMNKLHDELGKSVVLNTRKQLAPCLTNVWRLAYTSQNDVGQLPLTLMPFNSTEEFLSKVADFSYEVAVRDLNQQPLSEKEYKTLNALYQNSKKIQKELTGVQTKVIDSKLRWMDVETALAKQQQPGDNTIIDGFKTIDKKVQEFPEMEWGMTVQNMETKRQQRIKGISGKTINEQQAIDIAKKFVGKIASGDKVTVEKNGKGMQYNAFSIRITRKNASPINMDVTKKGGKVVWLLNEREVKQVKMNLDQAENSAKKFLKEKGYGEMVATERDTYGGLGVFTFVPKVEDVLIYPDSVTVKVALDNGDVNGFHAVEYLFNHKQRIIPKAKISAQRARTMINPHVKINESRLAMIQGKNNGKEVLAYEFSGQFENDVYMIYINAQTGEEEEVIKMNVGEQNMPNLGENA